MFHMFLLAGYGRAPVGPKCNTLDDAVRAAAQFPCPSGAVLIAVDSRTNAEHQLRVGKREPGGVLDG